MLYLKWTEESWRAWTPALPLSVRQLGADWFEGTPYARSLDRQPGFGLSTIDSLQDNKASWRRVDYDTLMAASHHGLLKAPNLQDGQHIHTKAGGSSYVANYTAELSALWPTIMEDVAVERLPLCSGNAWKDLYSYNAKLDLLLTEKLKC